MFRILGKTAIYNEKEYEFVDLDNGEYILVSNTENDMTLGFTKVDSKRFIKKIFLKDIPFVFQKDTKVLYKGDSFTGSIIDNDKIMLYTRDAVLGKKHQMIMRDKDEYYLYINLKEVDEIIQKWSPCPEYNV